MPARAASPCRAAGAPVERPYTDLELAAFREGLADLGLTYDQLMACLGEHLLRRLPERRRLLALRARRASGSTRSAATR